MRTRHIPPPDKTPLAEVERLLLRTKGALDIRTLPATVKVWVAMKHLRAALLITKAQVTKNGETQAEEPEQGRR